MKKDGVIGYFALMAKMFIQNFATITSREEAKWDT
jgi:hypothetical protein